MRQRAAEAWDEAVRRVRSKVASDPPAPAMTVALPPLVWHAQAMVPRVDLRDREAVITALEDS